MRRSTFSDFRYPMSALELVARVRWTSAMSLPEAVTLTLMSTVVLAMRVWLVALVWIRVAQVAGAVAQGSTVWPRAGTEAAIRARLSRCVLIRFVLQLKYSGRALR